MTEHRPAWAPEGYEVQGLLGQGAAGEVWQARAVVDGGLVALKRLRAGSAPGSRERLRREATLLATVDHDHLVRLRTVLSGTDGVVLVLDLAEGGSLAALLQARGRVTAGEVVTVVAPLAQALADVHGRGVLHGDVSPGNVLFDADGRPLLADLGVARLAGLVDGAICGTAGFLAPEVAAGSPATPAADVWSLGAVAVRALTGRLPGGLPLSMHVPEAPAALLAALEAAVSGDPSQRPSAGGLAASLLAACPPTPVRLVPTQRLLVAPPALSVEPAFAATGVRVPAMPTPSPAPDDEEGVPRRGGSRARQVLRHGSAVLAGVLLAVALGVVWGRAAGAPEAGRLTAPPPAVNSAGGPGSQPSEAPSAAARPWLRQVEALDLARAEAFQAADPALLGAVYTEGSEAAERDRAALAGLASEGRRVEGLRHEVVSVRPVADPGGSGGGDGDGDEVRLSATTVLLSHDVVGDGGEVVRTVARQAPSAVEMLLRETDGGWRIAAVESVTGAAGVGGA